MNRGTRRSVAFTVLLAFVGPAVAAQDGGGDSIDLEDGWETNNQSPGTVDIAVEPAEFETAPDNVNTYEVVVYGATNGISGYDNIEIVLEDTRTVELGADSNTTVTGDSETVLPRYSVTVATSDTTVDGELAVWPDVNGEPANDTTGDGPLNELNSDRRFSIFDVQELFLSFGSQPVQGTLAAFSFNDNSIEEVRIFDVQSLFIHLAGRP